MGNAESIFLGAGEIPVELRLKYANRHGLVAGATGTGKTVTLQAMAEQFSEAGIPVFLADVKGDLSGIGVPGGGNAKIEERRNQLGKPLDYVGRPTVFWDVFGDQGHPVRATVSEMGPLLLSRMLDLNDTQEGVLNVAFKLADDEGLLLVDMADLRAVLQYIADNAKEIQVSYGNVSAASIGAIQRQLLVLEQQGGEKFFGEPALALEDLMRCDPDGAGYINVLCADKLMQSPRLYATFLLWLLSELFEDLPEAGDLPKPKLVFFFDEAHLLFNDAPKSLVDKVEQVVRLIRSKGVGVYFVTQNPIDVPDTVLGQLGNRVQHALRAFTPRDQKAVKSSAETFRPNPNLDTAAVITELGVGEALVSVLEDKGAPSIVQRIFICPPLSRLGPVTPDEKVAIQGASPVRGKYDTAVDPESAREVLLKRTEQKDQEAELAKQKEEQEIAFQKQLAEQEKELERMRKAQEKELERRQREAERDAQRRAAANQKMVTNVATSVLRSAGSQLGRQLVRGILGGLMRGR